MAPEAVTATGPKTSRGAVGSERALATLWQRSHTLPDGISTEDARRFRVVYPGRANPRAGPDFLDAVLADDKGKLVTGDVELHLDAADWYAHGHDVDPGYNGVVLHVVLQPKGAAGSWQQSGTKAPVASIAAVVQKLGQPVAAPRSDSPQHEPAKGEALGETLDEAGEDRFRSRSRGFTVEIHSGEAERSLYAALMEALGYASNRRPFRRLAELVPISALGGLRQEPAATRAIATEAMLQGASGLLSHVRPPDRAQELRRLRRLLPSTRSMSARQWRLFRVRPANHPVARVTGAAHLVDRYSETGLLLGLLNQVEGGSPRALVESLMVRPFIGKGRAGDMAVNAVLPFFHAYGGATRTPGVAEGCDELYRTFPKLEENEITREMRRLLGGVADSSQVNTARRQQGLAHLYKGLMLGESHSLETVGHRQFAPPDSLRRQRRWCGSS